MSAAAARSSPSASRGETASSTMGQGLLVLDLLALQGLLLVFNLLDKRVICTQFGTRIIGSQFACVSTNTDAEAESYARKEAERKRAEAAEDFTCFTGTKVQILTLNVYRRGRRRRGREQRRPMT